MQQFGQFVINHWELWLAFVVVFILFIINEIVSQKKKAKALSPNQVVELMNDDKAILIDIRDKEAFKNGHILNSIQANPEDFEQQKMTKYKDKSIILVCPRGIQSQSLAAKLREQGFDPLVLGGGLEAWQSADLPLVKGK